MQLKDLAKAANVSVSTVSKALKGSKELHEDTIKHVLKIAEESGYFLERKKQRNKRAKVKGKVIIVVPEVVSVHYSKHATLITEKLRNKNIESQIFFCNFDKELKNLIVEQSLRDDGVAGIIALDGGFYKNFKSISDFPIVTAGEKTSITNDLSFGMKRAVEHLISLGHKKIYFASENLTVSKAKTFLSVVNECGLNDELCKCIYSEHRFEHAGFSIGKDLIDSHDIPTAVICAYDEIAFGLISAFMQNGLKVPDDVSVIGINNVPSAQFYPVPLTTIAFSSDEYCDALVEKLLDDINGWGKTNEYVVKNSLIIRKSTGKAKI